jgi:hypothetical protein
MSKLPTERGHGLKLRWRPCKYLETFSNYLSNDTPLNWDLSRLAIKNWPFIMKANFGHFGRVNKRRESKTSTLSKLSC